MTPVAHRRLVVASTCYAFVLVALGASIHTLGIRGAFDHYVERGELLLQGQFAPDPYHPFLYSELIAVATLAIGDAFAAARVVSSAAAGLFVYAATRLAAGLWGERVAFWSFALLAANGTVALAGVGAGSDMTAAAFWIVSVWLVLRARSPGAVALAGCALGLACATRLNSMLMLPVLAGLRLCTSSAMQGGRWRDLSRFGVGGLLGYLPNAIPSCIVHGKPMSTENWRNWALKLSPAWDESLLETNPYSDMWGLLREAWAPLLQRTLQDIHTMATATWPQTLVGEGAPSALGVTVGLVVMGAWTLLLARCWRPAWPLIVVALLWSMAIAATFFPQERLLMPVLPLAVMALPAASALVLPSRIADALLALVVLACVASTPAAVRKFRAEQPHAEVAAARRLAVQLGPLATIASHYSIMARHIPVRSVYVTSPPKTPDLAAHFVRNVLKLAEKELLDAVVVGPATMPGLSFAALAAAAPSGSVVERDGEAIVLRLSHARLWLARATATRTAAGVDLEIDLTRDDVVFVGVFAQQDGGDPAVVLLQPTGHRTFAASIPIGHQGVSTLAFTPACVLQSGQLVRAETLHVELP